MLDLFIRDLEEPRRESAPVAVLRYANVTAVRTSPTNAVQLDATGDGWVRYLAGADLSVDDVAVCVQQGTEWLVVGALA